MNETIAIINKYNIRAKKKLSQNFLADEGIIRKIADSARIDKRVAVIEIGSGLGSLTKELISRAGEVIAIEIDAYLCEILNNEYGCESLTVLNQDVLKTDITGLAQKAREKGFIVKVCANLPYHLTSPVIVKLLKETSGLSGLVLMMQKEVAERLLATPGTKDYGSLTPVVNYYANASLVTNVAPDCFIPRPGVQSSVVMFDMLDEKRVRPFDEELMFAVIRAAFGQRRKTLYNALSNQLIPGLGMSRETLLECFKELEATGISQNTRGETLSLAEFAQISDVIFNAQTL